MYDDILLPVDGSDPSAAALDHAQTLAAHEDATVHVLNTIELRPRGITYGRIPDPAMENIREDAEDLVAEAVADLSQASIDTESEVREGLATTVIPEYADEVGADLIVMGTHGRTGVERVLLGSATERTLRIADTPVLAVEPS